MIFYDLVSIVPQWFAPASQLWIILVHLWCRCCPWHRGRRLNTGRVTARYFNMCLGLCEVCEVWEVWAILNMEFHDGCIPQYRGDHFNGGWTCKCLRCWRDMRKKYFEHLFWMLVPTVRMFFFFFPDGFRIDSHWLTISSTPLIGNWRYIYMICNIYIYGIYYIDIDRLSISSIPFIHSLVSQGNMGFHLLTFLLRSGFFDPSAAFNPCRKRSLTKAPWAAPSSLHDGVPNMSGNGKMMKDGKATLW